MVRNQVDNQSQSFLVGGIGEFFKLGTPTQFFRNMRGVYYVIAMHRSGDRLQNGGEE